MMQEINSNQGFEIARSLIDGLRDKVFLPSIYPVLFDKGVDTGSFHPYMVSALLLLGNMLGFSPICDSPIFDSLDKLLTGEGSKRPDSVWFERGKENVRVLMEFERFASSSLQNKARNLVLMSNSHKLDLYLIALIYWATDIRLLEDLEQAVNIFRRGFLSKGSLFTPAPCPVIIIETKTTSDGTCLKIDGFITRKYIYGGEDKPYIVKILNK